MFGAAQLRIIGRSTQVRVHAAAVLRAVVALGADRTRELALYVTAGAHAFEHPQKVVARPPAQLIARARVVVQLVDDHVNRISVSRGVVGPKARPEEVLGERDVLLESGFAGPRALKRRVRARFPLPRLGVG